MKSITKNPFLMNGSPDWKRLYERGVYVELESLLRGARERRTGSDSTPHPQARGEEVAVDKASNISIKQERTQTVFLISKLQEWKTALENGLEPRTAE